MPPLEDAADHAVQTQMLLAGVPVTISRGDQSAGLTAVPGKTEYEQETTRGRIERRTLNAWTVRAADYQVGGTAVLPERGDLITAAGVTYRVVSAGGFPHFTYHGRSRRYLRIHSVEVDTP